MCAAIISLVASVALRPALGQPGTGVDLQRKTAAEAAFLQGKDQLAAGATAEACESFQKSFDLDPQLGAQYNLGLCYEKLGRLASAWGIYSELASTDTNKGRRADAAKRVKAITPRLVRVLVVVRGTTPGLRVSRGGVDITAAIGVATPVDPGRGEVLAEAPGFQPWSAEVSMAGEGTTITIELPALEKLPDVVSPSEPDPTPVRVREPVVITPVPPPPAAVGRGRRIVGLALVGGGVVALGAGGLLGRSAGSAHDDANAECGGDVTDCRGDLAAARALIDTSRSRALWSTIGFAVGGAAVVGGVVLYLTAPRGRERGIAVAPVVSPDAAGVAVHGRF